MNNAVLKIVQVASGGTLGYLLAEYMPWQVTIAAVALYIVALGSIAFEAYCMGVQS